MLEITIMRSVIPALTLTGCAAGLQACGSENERSAMSGAETERTPGVSGASGSSRMLPGVGTAGVRASASGAPGASASTPAGGRAGNANANPMTAGTRAATAGMGSGGGGAGSGSPAMSAASAGMTAAGSNGGTTKPGGVDGPDNSAACTASMMNKGSSGSGKYKVVIETNTDPGINEGTIFRPADLSGAERLPIFIWGEGGCARQGLSNQTANAEIASHGYFVIADGTPSGGSDNRSLGGADAGKPMLAYIDWAIAENHKPCSAYYHKLDPTKIATNGFSCGGLMAEGTAGDPRVTSWMINSSGGFMANQMLYQQNHGPVLIVLGGPMDIAYENGKRDYDNLAKGKYPVMLFSKDIGHGGDLFAKNGGDFTRLNLSWLNWWLKQDETMTGKGFLVGDGCTLCKDAAWEKASANIP